MIKFGTGGFRGIIGEDFTLENVSKVANGIAKYVLTNHLKKRIIISYDFRDKSFSSAKLISEILINSGINVLLSNKPTPTPAVMYNVKKLKLDLGIMITASHNPYQYNGIKIFETGGVDANITTTNKLELLINEDTKTTSKRKGKLVVQDILDSYFDFIKKFIDIKPNSDLKVLVDFIYGTGSQTIPYFKIHYDLKNLDIIRYKRVNPNNETIPNPTYEVLKDNIELQKHEKYDLIIGIDADGDRLGLLDENSRYVDNNEILALIYYYLVKHKNLKGDIVKNISTSTLIDKLAKKLGYQSHTVDVGFKNISAKMLEVDALIGGEASGGLTIRNYILGKDSTFSSLMILEILTNLNKPLSVLIDEVKTFSEYKKEVLETEITYKYKDSIINYLNKNKLFKDRKANKISINANYKYELENNDWALIRFSGTESVIRLVVESSSKENNEDMIFMMKNKLKENDYETKKWHFKFTRKN